MTLKKSQSSGPEADTLILGLVTSDTAMIGQSRFMDCASGFQMSRLTVLSLQIVRPADHGVEPEARPSSRF